MSTGRCLYRQVLGSAFDSLPTEVQRFHALQEHHVIEGRVEIDGAEKPIGALLCRLLRLPRASPEAPMRFELSASPAGERWVRHFPGSDMVSTMRVAKGQLLESLGPLRLRFALIARADRLVVRLEGLSFLHIPCPRVLMPAIEAEETSSPGRLHFRIQASLPWIGRVIRYCGYLELASITTSAMSAGRRA